MYWNWDKSVRHVVFKSWSFETPLGLYASCVAAALIALLAQILAGARLRHENKLMNERRRLITDIIAARQAAAAQQATAGVRIPGQQQQPTQHVQSLERQQEQLAKRPVGGTLLYGAQSLLSAIIMLILMTFNGFLIIACAVGSMLGYHYFGKAADNICC